MAARNKQTLGDNEGLLAPLSADPSVHELQNYVSVLKDSRGFPPNKSKAALALCIQAGQIADIIRKTSADDSTIEPAAEHELKRQIADALIYLVDVANLHGLSLSEAFRLREAENMKRKWSTYHQTAVMA